MADSQRWLKNDSGIMTITDLWDPTGRALGSLRGLHGSLDSGWR